MVKEYCHLIGCIIKEQSQKPPPFEKIQKIIEEYSLLVGREFQYELHLNNVLHIIQISCYATLEQCQTIVREIENVLEATDDGLFVEQDWIISGPEARYRKFQP